MWLTGMPQRKRRLQSAHLDPMRQAGHRADAATVAAAGAEAIVATAPEVHQLLAQVRCDCQPVRCHVLHGHIAAYALQANPHLTQRASD